MGGFEADPYLVKHWTRACLVHFEESGVCMRSLALRELQTWLPDQNVLCEPVSHCTADQVENRFGVSALRLTMLACLACKIPDRIDKAKLLRIRDGDAFRALAAHERASVDIPEDLYWPPGPKELVELFEGAGLL